MKHTENSSLAGKTIKFKAPIKGIDGSEIRVEDWWDRVSGESWMNCTGNIACMNYAMRSAFAKLPIDDEVVYGKVGIFGHLIHVSELLSEQEKLI